jgi:dTDP-4-amino-4,6-dideoxygalactose transaminase
MPIPLLDLSAQNGPLRSEILAAIGQVIDGNAFAGGPAVAAFEDSFARFCSTRHAVGVGNGTDALWFALLALGVGPGDEVITVAHTFIATAEAISFCGATPVFVDIDEETYTLDPSRLEAAITPRTKAIIPVHLYGQMADMDAIMAIARRHGLPVVEDACQAHGAAHRGRPAGSIGIAGCFSFYPGKNLGAFGEAGAVVTQDAALAGKLRVLRDHGQEKKYYHSVIGWNGRMDGVQGAVLSVKLRSLAGWNEARREHARRYHQHLAGLSGLVLPVTAPDRLHAFHLYVVRVADRDWVLAQLAEAGVHCGIHYPLPVHLQAAYRGLGYGRGSLPVTERCAKECLSLPMYAELTPEQIATVARALGGVLRSRETTVSAA